MTIHDNFSCSSLEWIMELCDHHAALSKNIGDNYGLVFDNLTEARNEFIMLDDEAKLDVFTYLLGRATSDFKAEDSVT